MPSGYDRAKASSENNFIVVTGVFEVNCRGRVRNRFTKELFEHHLIDGVPYVTRGKNKKEFLLRRTKGEFIAVADLVGLAFKDMSLSLDQMRHVSAYPIDGNELNLHPSNLVWIFPLEGIPDKEAPGYFIVPGFTKLSINREGNIRLRYRSTAARDFYERENESFFKGNLIPRNGTQVHRLLALTFLPYPRDVTILHVNHIDRNDTHNQLSNLEWTTPGQNQRHRYMHDLLGGKTPARWMYETGQITEEQARQLTGRQGFKVLDIETKEVCYFTCKQTAVRNYSLIDNQVDQALARASEVDNTSKDPKDPNKTKVSFSLVNSKLLFCFLNQTFPTDTDAMLKKHLSIGGQSRTTLVLDKETMLVRSYESAAKAAVAIGTTPQLLNKYLIVGDQRVANKRFLVQYKDRLKEWQLNPTLQDSNDR